jgi:hypothetical protein
MDDHGDLRRQIEDRDATIALLQARIDELAVSWKEIFEAGRRSALPPRVAQQGRHRDRTRLRVIQGGLGAAAAVAALRAALRAVRSHSLASASVALAAATAAGVPLMLTVVPGPAVTARVPAGPGPRVPAPSFPSRQAVHGQGRRQSPVSPAGRVVPSGTLSPSASQGQRPQAHGTPSPSPSPSQSQSQSPPASPTPLVSVTVSLPAPSPSPSHCLVTILGLCI